MMRKYQESFIRPHPCHHDRPTPFSSCIPPSIFPQIPPSPQTCPGAWGCPWPVFPSFWGWAAFRSSTANRRRRCSAPTAIPSRAFWERGFRSWFGCCSGREKLNGTVWIGKGKSRRSKGYCSSRGTSGIGGRRRGGQLFCCGIAVGATGNWGVTRPGCSDPILSCKTETGSWERAESVWVFLWCHSR